MTEPRLTLETVALALGARNFAFDLDLAGSGIIAVTGPSGSGKSTLLNLVSGFLRPQTGRVLIGGVDQTGIRPGDRPVTVMFQEHNLFDHVDVAGNIALGRRMDGTIASPRDIAAVLDRVGLSGFGPRQPRELSGGERQRVAFARALIRRRPYFLLDEPFAALDPDLRADMAGLLVDVVADTEALALIVTHDEAEAARIAGRRIVIRDGRIASGP